MEKRELPSRRGGNTWRIKTGDHKVYLRSGEYSDGTLGEIFLDTSKEGTFSRSMLHATAKLISLALQHGIPLEVLATACADEDHVLALVMETLQEHYPKGRASQAAVPRRSPQSPE